MFFVRIFWKKSNTYLLATGTDLEKMTIHDDESDGGD